MWTGTATLILGNFDGWVDEVVVRNVRPGTVTNSPAVVSITSPLAGAVYAGSSNVTITVLGTILPDASSTTPTIPVAT